MNRVTRAVAGLSLLAVAACGGPAGHRAHTGSLLARDAKRVHAAGVVGVVAQAVTPRGDAAARSGIGNRRTGGAPPLNGYIAIGSTTKTFTATVILRLAGEGRLSLSDTVGHWLPGVVAGNGNDGSKITIRELLQHTSGLYDYTVALIPGLLTPAGYHRNVGRRYTPAQLVDLAMRHRPLFAPGTRFSYSNTNYVLLGMLIKRVTGRTWEQEVHDLILRPLGLAHTLTPDQATRLPRPHARLYQQFSPRGPLVDTTIPPLGISTTADGAMFSTPSDLNRFFQALLGGRLLRPAQLAQMERTVPEPASSTVIPGARYGLGLERYPLPCGGYYWSHSGDGIGVDDENGVLPGGRASTVVYLTSRPATRGPFVAQLKAADQLVTDQLCAARSTG
ncbi:MAG: beta-lactamase family protein [Nocardiopsaceae bacterium]|jgi:D-alanyl-D-alanine carboxypeptidase|nr:beta-lactamase family protein [Nocardiopsaceae bacterium]